MHYLGLISLYIAFGSALLAVLAGARAQARTRLSRRANLLSSLAVALSTLVLVFAFLSNDFRLAYVARNSARSLPVLYKISALWAGQSGSLLLWLLVISLFSLAVQRTRRFRDGGFDLRINTVINMVRVLFIILLLFVTSPFELLADPPSNGSGLNPMLQSVGMVVHPPLLFMGFSGFLVPFAIVVSRLWARNSSDSWLQEVRPWALFAWLFLTAGIVSGGQWAYNELGWGGYWAWDPVENASLFPWLTGTALLHTLLLDKGHAGRKWWSYILIALTFALTIFGTFLTRSGVLDSVHAFSGGVLGSIFFVVLAAIVLFSAGLAWRRRSCLAEDPTDQGLSANLLGTAIKAGNVLYLLLFAAVLLGTMFPLLSRNLAGREIVLDETFFNQVTVPIFLVLFFLMGLAPVLAAGEVRRALLPLGLAVLVSLYVLFAVGGGVTASVTFGIAVFGAATHLGALFGLSKRRPKLGSTLVHVGVLLMLVGVTGSSIYTDDVFVTVEPGEEIQFGGYTVGYQRLQTRYGMDRYTVGTTLRLSRSGREVGTLTSEKTFWENRTQPSTQVGVFSTFKEELYLNLAGWEGQTARLHLQRFALVGWIWFGSWVVYLGAVLALLEHVLGRKLGKQVKAWQ